MERLLLFDGEEFTEINVDTNDITEFHKYLNCSCFDIVRRRIGDVYYDIFCDDEGLFKEDNPITAVSENGGWMLVGNLIFSHTNSAGETIGLSDNDIENIKSHYTVGFRISTGKMFTAIVCEY